MNETFNQILEAKIFEEAFAIEQVYFTKTDKKVNPKKHSPLKYWQGKIPVLVSAPHSVRHERKKKIKISDQFTGSLAYLIHTLTGAHALAVTKLYGGDPNYDESCIYKEYIAKIATEHKLSLIIDLHGASKEHDFDIDFGTMNGVSLLGKKEFHKDFEQCFENNGIKKLSNNFFSGCLQNTIIKFSAVELNIPAMQLEINRKYRAPNQSPEAYCKLVSGLIEAIKNIN